MQSCGSNSMMRGQARPAHSSTSRCYSRPCVVMVRASGFGKALSKVPKDLQEPKNLPKVTKLEWKKPLQIIKYPDPRLRAVNAKVAVFDDSLMELAREMITIMYEDDGVGLAAPQVGVNIRMMVFNPYGREKPGNETILCNPEIIMTAGPRPRMDEGCLSFPDILGAVERPRDLIVRAQNEKGDPVTLNLGSEDENDIWVARIFQHEYDHLQGILFHDRMKPNVLESVRSKLVAMEESYIKENPGVQVVRVPGPKVSKGFGAR